MISESEARRLHNWVNEAVAAGGKLLCGGERNGAMLQPTLIEDCPKDAALYREEAFGPAVTIEAYDDFDEVLHRVNDSKFGLQAGIFTRDLYKAQQAWDDLDVGGVVIGDVPSWRVDHMPYGGVKDSGLGREGVKFAMEDMSEIRLMVIR
jgi:acyl-CoA reductase-like NAD-dependent aldehyde dehydrogenase